MCSFSLNAMQTVDMKLVSLLPLHESFTPSLHSLAHNHSVIVFQGGKPKAITTLILQNSQVFLCVNITSVAGA